jgi:multiple antibiotic resistance protein
MWHTFFTAFVPLFVALDPIGLLPLYLGFTGKMDVPARRRVGMQALLTGGAIALAFMFVGQAIFGFLGVTAADFRIAGGILLLVLAVLDIVAQGKPAVHEPEIVGLVPLATPLIVGPAMLTTILVLSASPGHMWTALALLANFALLGVALWFAGEISRTIGPKVLLAVSKVVMILLAAIAVNFIRTGVFELLGRGAR